ncbi:FtsX-like permease family protein [Kurthia massiliensis]|uniref:FtsX-like permease family protein n=1 Tax=Kurthia massiliensis TaxID=1033739 RepID=UPI000288CF66|nr:ABC transporter permease [Kurthia massiliensis]
MKLSTLVFRTMWKNTRLYSLYFIALIFSSALYFGFLTLSDNPEVVEMNSTSVKASAAFQAGAVILVVIVFFFVLYANQLFMKRRSKEFGLYQLVGLSRGKIAWMLLIENSVLWSIAIAIGVGLGAIFSRFFALLFLKVVDIERDVVISFSFTALWKVLLIFAALFILMYAQSLLHMLGTKLIDLFRTASKTETRVKRFSWLSMLIGFVGIGAIIYGYYLSTKLFELENLTTIASMMWMMIAILSLTIGGTFLFFRFSVAMLLNWHRVARNGHVKIIDIMAISPIMHRMKANAISLTLITALTGLAIGVLTLSTIAYTSSSERAIQNMPYDMGAYNDMGEKFEAALARENIAYKASTFDLLFADVDMTGAFKHAVSKDMMDIIDTTTLVLDVDQVKQVVKDIDVSNDETILTGYTSITNLMVPMKTETKVTAEALNHSLTVMDIQEKSIVPTQLSYGMPVLVVSHKTYIQLAKKPVKVDESSFTTFTGYTIEQKEELAKAEKLFNRYTNNGRFEIKIGDEVVGFDLPSQHAFYRNNIENMGLIIFVTAFLGLAFLLTTGSILYFKQMSEADEEAPQFTILRNIGFTEQEMMKGIVYKQLFNFGFPLIIGSFHSYFAVKSGWMLFGVSFVSSFIIVLAMYIVLYVGFMLMTIRYYKKVIKG